MYNWKTYSKNRINIELKTKTTAEVTGTVFAVPVVIGAGIRCLAYGIIKAVKKD